MKTICFLQSPEGIEGEGRIDVIDCFLFAKFLTLMCGDKGVVYSSPDDSIYKSAAFRAKLAKKDCVPLRILSSKYWIDPQKAEISKDLLLSYWEKICLENDKELDVLQIEVGENVMNGLGKSIGNFEYFIAQGESWDELFQKLRENALIFENTRKNSETFGEKNDKFNKIYELFVAEELPEDENKTIEWLEKRFAMEMF